MSEPSVGLAGRPGNPPDDLIAALYDRLKQLAHQQLNRGARKTLDKTAVALILDGNNQLCIAGYTYQNSGPPEVITVAKVQVVPRDKIFADGFDLIDAMY
jgi:hypothetical protein